LEAVIAIDLDANEYVFEARFLEKTYMTTLLDDPERMLLSFLLGWGLASLLQ
jgi:hypothetical protein